MHLEHSQSSYSWSMHRMHVHVDHELYFLVSGKRRYFVGDSIYDLLPGELILIPRRKLHRTTSLGNYNRYVLYFSENDASAFDHLSEQGMLSFLLESGCFHLPPNAVLQVRKALENLAWEQNSDKPYSKQACRHLLNEILLCVLRNGQPKSPCELENADKVQDVARYITAHYDQELSLADAAELACMERTYFSKRFKQLTGFGFLEYLTQTRLQAAEQMLADSGISVGEVASKCGFTSGNYFGDVFKKWKGCSPAEYRKRLHTVENEKQL